jgi:hypothetical protein
MFLFIDHVAAKTPIISAMDTLAGGSMRLIEGSRSLIHNSFVTSVKRAIANGDLRSDTDPNDFIRASGHLPHHGYTRLEAKRPPSRQHTHHRLAPNEHLMHFTKTAAVEGT